MPTQPYWPTEEWHTRSPEAAGLDPAQISQTITAGYKALNGIVIVKQGFIVFERYYNGHTASSPNHVASVTKSVLSTLIGIAESLGLLPDLNQPVLDFFPDYPAFAKDLKKRSVTIRHLLTMTAPFPWNINKSGTASTEPLDRMRRQSDWAQYCLKHLGLKGQHGAFHYSNASAHLLSTILTRITGQSTLAFANEHLFGPIGMRVIPEHKMPSFSKEAVFGSEVKGWVSDPAGINTGGWGLTLTPRDMARLGLLYLRQGHWTGKQVVPEAWVADSLTPHAPNYGYLWWLRKGVFAALGSGGNAMYCLPEKELVIAVTGRGSWDPWELVQRVLGKDGTATF